MTEPSLAETLRRYLRDPDASWSCGSFGAIAEFARDPDEAIDTSHGGLAVVTARGGICFDLIDEVRPIACELAGPHPDTWQHGLALCLPIDRCRLAGRKVLTELGPDIDALRPEDRQTILFDLGLAIGHADICVRTDDPELLRLMRDGLDRSLLSPEGLSRLSAIARLSPQRVLRCCFGRVEVYQPIPGPDDKTPSGPHTHVMPKLLALRRTHAATLPIPPGWVPCMMLYPPRSVEILDGGAVRFDRNRHQAFQALWSRYGIRQLVDLKAEAFEMLSTQAAPLPGLPPPLDRAGRAIIEVARRQWRQIVNVEK